MGTTVLKYASTLVQGVIMSMVFVILDANLVGQGTFVEKVNSRMI